MGRVSQSSTGGVVSISGTVEVDSTGFSNGASTQATLSTTSTQVFAANINRKYAHISNNSGYPIYIQYGAPAAQNQGIKIPNNTLYTIEFNNLWLGVVNAVGIETNQIIDIFEGE